MAEAILTMARVQDTLIAVTVNHMSLRLLVPYLIACALPVYGQSRSDSTGVDSLAERRIILVDPGISLGRPFFLLPPSINTDFSLFGSQLVLPGDAPLDRIPFTAGLGGSRVDLTLPLRLQLGEQKKWSAVTMTLSAAGAGAAAYMAYEHIKKYGLFK